MRYGIEVAAFICIITFPIMMNSFRVASPSFRRIASSSSVLPSRLLKNDFQYTSSISQRKLFATIPNKKEEDVKPTDIKFKISELWSMYGFVAVGTYGAIYVSTLASIFVSMDYDLFNAATFGFDPIGAVKKVCDIVESTTGNTDLPGYIRENPRVGTFAISWVMTKFTEPLRLAVTIAIVPSIARLVGKAPAKSTAPK